MNAPVVNARFAAMNDFRRYEICYCFSQCSNVASLIDNISIINTQATKTSFTLLWFLILVMLCMFPVVGFSNSSVDGM